MEDYWILGPSEMEFFEAICALAGSTKGCELGFKRAFVGADVWKRIYLLYAHLLAAAQRKDFTCSFPELSPNIAEP
jgi:hypothetical protein